MLSKFYTHCFIILTAFSLGCARADYGVGARPPIKKSTDQEQSEEAPENSTPSQPESPPKNSQPPKEPQPNPADPGQTKPPVTPQPPVEPPQPPVEPPQPIPPPTDSEKPPVAPPADPPDDSVVNPPTDPGQKPPQKVKRTQLLEIKGHREKADILIIVDNSRSMSFEHSNMGRRMQSFLKKIERLDWQLALITTDMRAGGPGFQGQLVPLNKAGVVRADQIGSWILKSSDPAAAVEKIFAQTIQRKSGEGSQFEQGLAAANRFLLRWKQNESNIRSLLREDASLQMVLLSDANETPSQKPQFENLPGTLLKRVNQYFNSQKTFQFHSIIVRDGDVGCLSDKVSNNESYGILYAWLSKKTNGIIGSVCDQDYGAQLADIGERVDQAILAATLVCDVSSIQDVKVSSESGIKLEIDRVEGRQLYMKNPFPLGRNKIELNCVR